MAEREKILEAWNEIRQDDASKCRHCGTGTGATNPYVTIHVKGCPVPIVHGHVHATLPSEPEPTEQVEAQCLEDELYAKYTKDTPVVVKGEPDARKVWLVVEHQSFSLGGSAENAEVAQWMRRMLAKALVKIVEKANSPRGIAGEG